VVQEKEREVGEIREKYMREVERNRGMEGDQKVVGGKIQELQENEGKISAILKKLFTLKC
jgi:hypothetical protein